MRIKTVGELIEALQEFPEDMPLMAMHQPSWPLVEYVGGLYQKQPEYECPNCGNEDMQVYPGPFVMGASGAVEVTVMYCSECDEEHPAPTVEPMLYVVLNGQPHDNPYGTKEAWNEI